MAESVSYDHFSQCDFRVGTIRAAEAIEGSNKLLKLTVDVGEIRTIVAGIARAYAPESLIGKQIVVLVNLESRTLMGIESCGMLLAAGDDTSILLTPDEEVPPGSRIH